MKRLAALLALALGPVVDGRVPATDCYLSPQSTLMSYWHRMLEHRHSEALECFVGGTKDAAGMLSLPSFVELRCRDFDLQWRRGSTVDVSYKVEYRVAMGDSLQRFPTGDRLVLTAQGWKISHPLLFAGRNP
jgi:hypothetical protein